MRLEAGDMVTISNVAKPVDVHEVYHTVFMHYFELFFQRNRHFADSAGLGLRGISQIGRFWERDFAEVCCAQFQRGAPRSPYHSHYAEAFALNELLDVAGVQVLQAAGTLFGGIAMPCS